MNVFLQRGGLRKFCYFLRFLGVDFFSSRFGGVESIRRRTSFSSRAGFSLSRCVGFLESLMTVTCGDNLSEIKVTPEMVEAGCCSLFDWLGDLLPAYYPDSKEIVKDIFLSMLAVRRPQS